MTVLRGCNHPNTLGPFGPEKFGSVDHCACSVDYVVDNDGVPAGHLADHREGCRDVVLVGFPPLVHKGDVGVQVASVLLGSFHASGIRRDDGGRTLDHVLQVLDEDRQSGQVVERLGDKALNLPGVEIHRHQPVRSGR